MNPLKLLGTVLGSLVLVVFSSDLATAASLTVPLGGADFICAANCSLDPYPVVGTGGGNYFGEIVSAPGLASLRSVTLNFEYSDGLTQPYSQLYYVNVNGKTIASFAIDGIGDQAVHVFDGTFSFEPIFGPTYTMTLSAPVSGFQPGELAWYHDGSSTFTLSDSSPIPEPSAASFLILAAFALPVILRSVKLKRD